MALSAADQALLDALEEDEGSPKASAPIAASPPNVAVEPQEHRQARAQDPEPAAEPPVVSKAQAATLAARQAKLAAMEPPVATQMRAVSGPEYAFKRARNAAYGTAAAAGHMVSGIVGEGRDALMDLNAAVWNPVSEAEIARPGPMMQSSAETDYPRIASLVSSVKHAAPIAAAFTPAAPLVAGGMAMSSLDQAARAEDSIAHDQAMANLYGASLWGRHAIKGMGTPSMNQGGTPIQAGELPLGQPEVGFAMRGARGIAGPIKRHFTSGYDAGPRLEQGQTIQGTMPDPGPRLQYGQTIQGTMPVAGDLLLPESTIDPQPYDPSMVEPPIQGDGFEPATVARPYSSPELDAQRVGQDAGRYFDQEMLRLRPEPPRRLPPGTGEAPPIQVPPGGFEGGRRIGKQKAKIEARTQREMEITRAAAEAERQQQLRRGYTGTQDLPRKLPASIRNPAAPRGQGLPPEEPSTAQQPAADPRVEALEAKVAELEARVQPQASSPNNQAGQPRDQPVSPVERPAGARPDQAEGLRKLALKKKMANPSQAPDLVPEPDLVIGEDASEPRPPLRPSGIPREKAKAEDLPFPNPPAKTGGAKLNDRPSPKQQKAAAGQAYKRGVAAAKRIQDGRGSQEMSAEEGKLLRDPSFRAGFEDQVQGVVDE